MEVVALLLILAVCLALLGTPIALGLAVVDVLGLALSGLPLISVAQIGFAALNNSLLLAVPFFIFLGSLMSRTGAAVRLTGFVSILVQGMRGGLGTADIASSVIFADMSGSATSDTAAIGSVMIPAMRRNGYNAEYATALQAAAGSLGLLFPPSTSQIIYAYVANVAIGKLFIASILPGLLVAFSFMVINYIHARRGSYPAGRLPTRAAVWSSFKSAVLVIMVPVIILGGILGGVFTPTEAGTVAVAYILFISFAVYRDLSWRDLLGAMRDTVSTTARVGMILTMAILLGTILALHMIPQQIASGTLGLSTNPLVVLLMINVILLVLHTCLETSSAILILVPVFLPIIQALNIDPLQFGVILLVNSAIGITLPPIGFCLYIACSISGVRLERAARAMLPFTAVLLFDLALVTLFPQITLVFAR